MSDEVAVFIDFENLRYGLLNNYGQEPDIMALVEKAKKYGRPSIMRAYADFTEHPPEITRRLQVAGVEAINVPVKRSTRSRGGRQVERIKNAADMVLALDAMIEALEADKNRNSKIFLLVTGDADYVKLVTHLRNRFGQRVVIAGVPGSIANDLITAAGEPPDPVEVAAWSPIDRAVLKKALVAMVKRGPAPLTYWSLKIIDQWSQDSRQGIPGNAKEKRDTIAELVNEGVFVTSAAPTGKAIQAQLDETKAQELGYL